MATTILADDAVLDDGVPHPNGVDLPGVPVPPPLRWRRVRRHTDVAMFPLDVVTERRTPGAMEVWRARHLAAHARSGDKTHLADAAYCAAVITAAGRED